ncbi:MAG: hypothetical protein RIM99_19005 [Cyclobacteriaceae bacterium]
MKRENGLIVILLRLGLLLFLFNGFSQLQHPLIRYYDGGLKLTEEQLDSLVTETLREPQTDYLLALAHYQLGVIEGNREKDVSAFKKYQSALEYLKKLDTTDVYLHSALWRNQGVILYNYKLYEEAVQLYKKALESSYKYSTARGVSTEYNIAMAMMWYDPHSAVNLFTNLKEKVPKDSVRQARIYNQLGLLNKRDDQFDIAIYNFRKGLELDVRGIAKANLLQNISDTYYHQHDYSNQEHYLKQVLETPEANRFIALMDLGECYLLQGRKFEAQRVLKEAETMYTEQQLKGEHVKLFQWLKIVSDDPIKYANKQVEEQFRLIGKLEQSKEILRIVTTSKLKAAFDGIKKSEEKVFLYRALAILCGFIAVSILLTWKIWLYRLRNNLSKKIGSLTNPVRNKY